ncbi:hypothetical protein G9A89_010739 [Geosiphon pyriformis]|nr:hypothetical protein G9A89_010739 [Geosiphon pyriformis]
MSLFIRSHENPDQGSSTNSSYLSQSILTRPLRTLTTTTTTTPSSSSTSTSTSYYQQVQSRNEPGIIESESFNLICRWGDCNFQASSMKEIYAHGEAEHLRRLKKEMKFHCDWGLCPTFTDSQEELIEHILKNHLGAVKNDCGVYGPDDGFRSKIFENRYHERLVELKAQNKKLLQYLTPLKEENQRLLAINLQDKEHQKQLDKELRYHQSFVEIMHQQNRKSHDRMRQLAMEDYSSNKRKPEDVEVIVIDDDSEDEDEYIPTNTSSSSSNRSTNAKRHRLDQAKEIEEFNSSAHRKHKDRLDFLQLDGFTCEWVNCGKDFLNEFELAAHIRRAHFVTTFGKRK